MFPFIVSGTIIGNSNRLIHSLGTAIKGLKKYRTSWRYSERAALTFKSSIIKWSFNPLNGVSGAQLAYKKDPAQKVMVHYRVNLTGALISGILFGLWVGLDLNNRSENFLVAIGVALTVYASSFFGFLFWAQSTVD